jgi:hypothetical protein
MPSPGVSPVFTLLVPCVADLPKADAKLQLQCEVEYAKLRKVTDALPP